MLKRSRVLASAAVVALVTGLGAPAWAETLKDAIALAYQTNPNLLAQRASQRALDETVVQARSGLPRWCGPRSPYRRAPRPSRYLHRSLAQTATRS